MKITFVIPVYNERDTLEDLAAGIVKHTEGHETRVLFVDDGSTDGSREVLQRLRHAMSHVEVIRFRRNAGKSAALAAGFAHTDGDVVFTMDADLQDDPAEIPHFLEKLEEGFDVVVGWKMKRHDPWHKTFPSHVYNSFVAKTFRLPLHDINCGFKAYRAEVVKRLRVYGEMHRLLPALAAGLGYRIAEIPVTHHARRYGVSKYGFERFARGALDVLAVWFLLHHAYTPGHFFGKVSMAGMLKSFVLIVLGGVLGLAMKSWLVWLTFWVAAVIVGAVSVMILMLGLVTELFLRHVVPLDPSDLVEDDSTR